MPATAYLRRLVDERPAITAGVLLFVLYLATTAPTLTLWDSGELLSAVDTLGIPHPPGTPLFVFLAHVWATLLPGVPFAFAVNVASGVATATACALLARVLLASLGARSV